MGQTVDFLGEALTLSKEKMDSKVGRGGGQEERREDELELECKK